MKRLTQFGWYLVALLYTAPALAEGSALPAPTSPVEGRSITLDNIVDATEALVDTFLSLAAIGMIVGIIYTGLQMILSRGNEAEFAKAKKQLGYVIIGSLVILGVGLILNTIASFANDPLRTFGL